MTGHAYYDLIPGNLPVADAQRLWQIARIHDPEDYRFIGQAAPVLLRNSGKIGGGGIAECLRKTGVSIKPGDALQELLCLCCDPNAPHHAGRCSDCRKPWGEGA